MAKAFKKALESREDMIAFLSESKDLIKLYEQAAGVGVVQEYSDWLEGRVPNGSTYFQWIRPLASFIIYEVESGQFLSLEYRLYIDLSCLLVRGKLINVKEFQKLLRKWAGK